MTIYYAKEQTVISKHRYDIQTTTAGDFAVELKIS
jgi:hypothetical protein